MVSTTILEWGEASRIPSRISWAPLICMSSSVMTRSGFVLPTWEKASLPVEDLPTTSTSSREERMASSPSLKMMWSSAKCIRTAAMVGGSSLLNEFLFGPIEGRKHVRGRYVLHAPGVPVGANIGAEELELFARARFVELHPEDSSPYRPPHPVGHDEVRPHAEQRVLQALGGAKDRDLGVGTVPADGEGEHLRVHARCYGYKDAWRFRHRGSSLSRTRSEPEGAQGDRSRLELSNP